MSLISEALRKAHLEALQQDRDQRRFYMNHGGRQAHVTRGGSRTSIAIAILASLCVICAGALLYITLDRSSAASAAAPVVEASRPVPQAVAVPRAPEVVTTPEQTTPAAATRAEKPAIATAASDKTRPRKRASDRPAKTASAVVASRPAPPRLERDGFRAGETYGSPVLGPFGTEVVLTGITALRGQHVAIINGSTVRAGTAVGPFVVEEIEARRVRLKYVDISFFVVQ